MSVNTAHNRHSRESAGPSGENLVARKAGIGLVSNHATVVFGRACPGHPRLLMPENEDVDARIKYAQDSLKSLRIKTRHAKVVEALSPDSRARKRESTVTSGHISWLWTRALVGVRLMVGGRH